MRSKLGFLDTLETFILAFIFAILINAFLMQPTLVDGWSMEPNLHDQQRLLVDKLSYHIGTPQRGDVVVVNLPGYPRPLIKRVIGVPGNIIAIRDGHVYINGTLLQEPYVGQWTTNVMAPKVVPPGEVFVLGDNRKASSDSRVFGTVPFDYIIGKAWLSYWPPETIGLVK
jgi:signal peptidase I